MTIRSRAAGYDERNEFFSEDLEVLSALGYLKPRSLADTITDQRLLAAHAPATELGVGMHLTWMGVARDMVTQGFTQFEWILEEGAAGELFAFGVSERVIPGCWLTPPPWWKKQRRVLSSLAPRFLSPSVTSLFPDD